MNTGLLGEKNAMISPGEFLQKCLDINIEMYSQEVVGKGKQTQTNKHV